MLLSIEYQGGTGNDFKKFKVVADRVAVDVDRSDEVFQAVEEVVRRLMQGADKNSVVEAYVDLDGKRLALPRLPSCHPADTTVASLDDDNSGRSSLDDWIR